MRGKEEIAWRERDTGKEEIAWRERDTSVALFHCLWSFLFVGGDQGLDHRSLCLVAYGLNQVCHYPVQIVKTLNIDRITKLFAESCSFSSICLLLWMASNTHSKQVVTFSFYEVACHTYSSFLVNTCRSVLFFVTVKNSVDRNAMAYLVAVLLSVTMEDFPSITCN